MKNANKIFILGISALFLAMLLIAFEAVKILNNSNLQTLATTGDKIIYATSFLLLITSIYYFFKFLKSIDK